MEIDKLNLFDYTCYSIQNGQFISAASALYSAHIRGVLIRADKSYLTRNVLVG